MFEHWSERRRRWFLIAFSATAWLLFSNAVAYLGSTFTGGGIGPDGAHFASLVGVTAAWTLVVAAFKLAFRHYLFAVLFGVGLSSMLTEVGFHRHAAAGIWSIACDVDEGTACHNLATYYDEGSSPIGGTLDSGPLHQRACALGGPETAESCAIADSLGLGDQEADFEAADLTRRCERGARSACLTLARQLEEQGRLTEAYDRYADACDLSRRGDPIEGCAVLLDSGYHNRRLQACDALETLCATSASHVCMVATRRCERARSPHAGVTP